LQNPTQFLSTLSSFHFGSPENCTEPIPLSDSLIPLFLLTKNDSQGIMPDHAKPCIPLWRIEKTEDVLTFLLMARILLKPLRLIFIKP